VERGGWVVRVEVEREGWWRRRRRTQTHHT
jgi:hypothetical protein